MYGDLGFLINEIYQLWLCADSAVVTPVLPSGASHSKSCILLFLFVGAHYCCVIQSTASTIREFARPVHMQHGCRCVQDIFLCSCMACRGFLCMLVSFCAAVASFLLLSRAMQNNAAVARLMLHLKSKRELQLSSWLHTVQNADAPHVDG